MSIGTLRAHSFTTAAIVQGRSTAPTVSSGASPTGLTATLSEMTEQRLKLDTSTLQRQLAAQKVDFGKLLGPSFRQLAAQKVDFGKLLGPSFRQLSAQKVDFEKVIGPSFRQLSAQKVDFEKLLGPSFRQLSAQKVDFEKVLGPSALKFAQRRTTALSVAAALASSASLPATVVLNPADDLHETTTARALSASVRALPRAQQRELEVLALWVVVYFLAFVVATRTHSALASSVAALAFVVSICHFLDRLQTTLSGPK
jgi:hypothetical protein